VWTPLKRTLLTAVGEMIDDRRVRDMTWDALASHFEPAELLELVFVTGSYVCLAGVLNSVGLRSAIPPMSPVESIEESATSRQPKRRS
jgi:4-carboxymuconolactone decarboxylase